MKFLLIRSILLLAILFILSNCSTLLPKPPCPPEPNFNLGYGTPAKRAANTSIAIDLGQSYMRDKIRALVETPKTDSSGITVLTVKLEEKMMDEECVNLISITIEPWLKGASGNSASLQRRYILQLQIVPYLITPTTISDVGQRSKLLCTSNDPSCTAESGVILALEFYELFSNIHQSIVSCGSSNFDLIDSKVLTGIYKSLEKQEPVRLPTEQLTNIVSLLNGNPIKLDSVSIGSDLDLRIGLRYDQGSPKPFDSNTWLSHFPNEDWGVSIDTSFVASSIRRNAIKEVEEADLRARVDQVNIAFTENGFDIRVKGTLPICSDIKFTSEALVTPGIFRDASGRSVLRVFSGEPLTEAHPTGLQKLCYAGDLFLRTFSGGWANATVVTNGGEKCPVLSIVQFSSGPDDEFYATAVDTDGVFYLVGRSTFIDRIRGARPGGARPSSPPCQ